MTAVLVSRLVRGLRQALLRLDEEPDDEEVMDPRKQGQFIHDVFERFFSTWQARGHRAITPGTLDVFRNGQRVPIHTAQGDVTTAAFTGQPASAVSV